VVDTLTWCWDFQTKINSRRFGEVYLFVLRCLVWRAVGWIHYCHEYYLDFVGVDYNVCKAVWEFKVYHTQWHFSTGFTKERLYIYFSQS